VVLPIAISRIIGSIASPFFARAERRHLRWIRR
jgi:hypothetical protein